MVETEIKSVSRARILIGEVVESGVLPTLVSFLRPDKEQALQKEATWVVTNLGGEIGGRETSALVEAGAIPLLVALLSSKNEDIRENATMALGNIAGDSVGFRDLVLESGAMAPLLHCLLHCQNVGMLRTTIWVVTNLCRYKPSPALALVSPAIPVLGRCLRSPDVEVLRNACWALSYIVDGPNNRIERIVEENSIAPRLIELLDHESDSVREPALRVIANIVTGTNAHTKAVLDCPMALPLLKKLLDDPNPLVRKEGCFALSNITAGISRQIQMVIDAGVIPSVVGKITSNEEGDALKKEAVWVLGNIFSGEGSDDQIVYLVEQNVISGFLSYLDNDDSETVLECLDGIVRVLDIGEDSNRFAEGNPFVAKIEGSDDFYKLEDLQIHKYPEISEKAQMIMDKHFEQVKFKGIK